MILPETESPGFYTHYLNLVNEDFLAELNHQLESYTQFIQQIPNEKHLYKYAENKWTIKEVVGHNTDTERIKATAAFRIARNDKASLPGFNEDEYVLATDFNSREMSDLIDEFIAVRKSTIAFAKSLNDNELKRIGTASGKNVSARALLYFLVGHIRHHENILKERYGV